MAVTLRGNQLRQLLKRLKVLPRSQLVTGQLQAEIDNKLNHHDVIVDRWPDFKAVLLRPDQTNHKIKFLHNNMQVYAEEPESLKNLLQNKGLIDWSKNVKFAAVESRLEPAVCEAAREQGQSLIRSIDAYLVRVNRETLKLQPVPEGHRISSLHPDHCDLVNSNWRLKSQGSAAYLRLLAETLPSCCLYNKQGNLIGYTLSYNHGTMGMLHVMEEHRRKGYAGVITTHLVNTWLKQCEYVYGYIEKVNKASFKPNTKLGWKAVEDVGLFWLNP